MIDALSSEALIALLQVVMIDGADLTRFSSGGLGAIVRFLHDEAESTMRMKRTQIERHVDAGDGHALAYHAGAALTEPPAWYDQRILPVAASSANICVWLPSFAIDPASTTPAAATA